MGWAWDRRVRGPGDQLYETEQLWNTHLDQATEDTWKKKEINKTFIHSLNAKYRARRLSVRSSKGSKDHVLGQLYVRKEIVTPREALYCSIPWVAIQKTFVPYI